MIRRLLIGCLLALGLAAATAKADEISGTATVVDASTMMIAGYRVRLADIVVPAPGTACVWNNQELDCGTLARAGLMDITAGARVVCEPVGSGTHRCMDGSFDLAFGLIHAGWAVPRPGAPAHYVTKMQDAKANKRALWSAREVDGERLIAVILQVTP